jgi:hypothetical protein
MENFELNISTSKKRNECDMCNYNYNNEKISNYYLYNDTMNKKDDIYINSSKIIGLNSNNMNGYVNNIELDNKFRNGTDGSKITNLKGREYKELPTRLFIGSPYMSSGQSILKHPDLYSKLINGVNTHTKKSCGSIADASINRFIPLVPCIAKNVQNTDHIIPEYWVRGGMNTRSVIRNADYLKRCRLSNRKVSVNQ